MTCQGLTLHLNPSYQPHDLPHDHVVILFWRAPHPDQLCNADTDVGEQAVEESDRQELGSVKEGKQKLAEERGDDIEVGMVGWSCWRDDEVDFKREKKDEEDVAPLGRSA